ncbi:MAG: DNA repair protein RecN [Anaerovibrio sp.]|uniref:DNA repair protein RecN n=1 Tax=Anaerovibrio sp. TaxID=1872532 RepID=UPI0025E98CF3|nr:DNA repair protein RecN [Anaerovibrio sp.]MCR5175839.1 DNA repair protein RecN [Anaerovibrio sp.]
MLNTLTIWNFALLEQVQIDFDKGLNILTGETGAGKSILIDALGAILGNRLSTELIREGADWLRVEAIFSLDGQQNIIDYLQENAIDASEGELIITRQITNNGRGTILINGCHTTAAVLKKLGTMLVDIHGQNENLGLLQTNNQFRLVDGSDDRISIAMKEYRESFEALRGLQEQLAAKKQNSVDNAQKLDMLKWQIQEIEAAQLQIGEDEELERDINKLSNAERISNQIGSACEYLYGGGNSGLGVIAGLEEVLENLRAMSRFDESLDKVSDIINEAYIQIKESAYEVRDYGDELEFNPQLLDKLQSRMDTIDKLRKKYGSDIGEILEFARKSQQQIFDIENYDEDIASLEKSIEELSDKTHRLAERLTSLRQQAGERLAAAIEEHLHALGMPNARLEIAVTDSGELSSQGGDDLAILFSANPGQTTKPIQKVASGGELSRIVLAIKTVTAFRDDSPASMVFDEIDTGIGGKTAQMVAERIAMIAAGKQVLCITHLPQIACMADVHLYIRKQVSQGQTYTSVSALSQGERVNEIARMASGVDISAASLDNAREMLVNADVKKKNYTVMA